MFGERALPRERIADDAVDFLILRAPVERLQDALIGRDEVRRIASAAESRHIPSVSAKLIAVTRKFIDNGSNANSPMTR